MKPYNMDDATLHRNPDLDRTNIQNSSAVNKLLKAVDDYDEPEESSEESEESTNGESAASLFDGIDDEEHELEEEGLQGDNSEENDVVFGDGRIDQKSMRNFVAHYPDSTLKFLMRKKLDGRPLPVGYEEIYSQWENRGMSRGRLKKYLFKLMEWKNFPDIPVHDVVNKIREHQYFLEIK